MYPKEDTWAAISAKAVKTGSDKSTAVPATTGCDNPTAVPAIVQPKFVETIKHDDVHLEVTLNDHT